MDDPVIVITGASRGLGAACARECASLGAQVVLSARSETDLQQVAAQIESQGGSAQVSPADVRIESDCRRLIGSTVEGFDRIDALVNNAGLLDPIQRVSEADSHAWSVNWQVNVLGPVMLCRAALPALRRSAGRIINVSSGAAVKQIEGWGAYSIAKAAINHLTRLLAEEEPRITTIAFRPGSVDTEMQSQLRERGSEAMASDRYQEFVRMHEQGELLPPEEPARAMASLALEAPHDWSGQFIRWNEDRVQALVTGLFGTD